MSRNGFSGRSRRRSLAIIALVGVLTNCSTSRPAGPPRPTAATGTSIGTSTIATSTTVAETTSTVTAPPTSTTTTFSPARPAVIVRHGDTRRSWLALTFDAGSDVGNTSAILDLLRARHIHATFSITGTWARANAQLARRIARDGHVIVNHTDTHLSFTGVSTGASALTSAERSAQLARADASIVATAGISSRPWFRPPYGDIDASTPIDVARAGYRYVLLWTVDSLGWKGLAPATVAARCLDGATPGGILLLHVGSASTDAAALPRILDGLRSRGFALVTVTTPGFITG